MNGIEIRCLRSVVLKVESATPRGPGAECGGSASIQSNIGGPCTFKEKIENDRILFGDIEKGLLLLK